MLEEMGRPYQLIDKSTAAGDLQTADYLRLNPNARNSRRWWRGDLGIHGNQQLPIGEV
jgi:hypothetical protein